MSKKRKNLEACCPYLVFDLGKIQIAVQEKYGPYKDRAVDIKPFKFCPWCGKEMVIE